EDRQDQPDIGRQEKRHCLPPFRACRIACCFCHDLPPPSCPSGHFTLTLISCQIARYASRWASVTGAWNLMRDATFGSPITTRLKASSGSASRALLLAETGAPTLATHSV